LLESSASDTDIVFIENGLVERFGRVDGDEFGFLDISPYEFWISAQIRAHVDMDIPSVVVPSFRSRIMTSRSTISTSLATWTAVRGLSPVIIIHYPSAPLFPNNKI
jgi:hypothetical protein